jgi:acetoin utilization deacetylase AcuC-like enzyme
LTAVERGVDAAELGPDLVRLPAREAERAEIERVHDPGYLDALAELCSRGGGRIDADTRVSAGSWTTARWTAGAGLAAISALERGEGDAAFVAGRPPGHHADRARGAGFCLVNNIAVAAAALADQGERVAIVDWDVHHGNGTQDLFWNDPRVLYASTHQWPAYPGTGRISEHGGPDALGLTVNVPLPPGATGDVARAAVDRVVGPAIEEFRPGWLLISAGFDAHRADPLADLAWSAGDYADLVDQLAPLVPGGRVAAFLEGGYDLDALQDSVQATVSALAGGDARPEAPTSGGPGLDAVGRALESRAAALG